MKKMINTLVAVSATIVIVSTVDAKNMGRRGTATSEVKQINDASKEVIVSPTQENIANIQDALATDDEEKLALQEAQAHELDLIGKIAIQKHIMSAMPRVPYIWDTRTQTEKDARKVADEKLKALENDMKQTKANIAKMTASVGAGYATSTKLAIATLVGLGVIAAGAATEYYLRPEGYMRTMLGHKQRKPWTAEFYPSSTNEINTELEPSEQKQLEEAFKNRDEKFLQARDRIKGTRTFGQEFVSTVSTRAKKDIQELSSSAVNHGRAAIAQEQQLRQVPTFGEIGQGVSQYWKDNMATPVETKTPHISSQLTTEQIQANKAIAQARTEAAKERARQRTARQLQMRGQ